MHKSSSPSMECMIYLCTRTKYKLRKLAGHNRIFSSRPLSNYSFQLMHDAPPTQATTQTAAPNKEIFKIIYTNKLMNFCFYSVLHFILSFSITIQSIGQYVSFPNCAITLVYAHLNIHLF